MITLTTLSTAHPADVFVQAANHLLRQQAPAMHNGQPAIHALDGRTDAAGCFITPEQFKQRHIPRNALWSDLVRRKQVTSAHKDLIIRLNCVHDDMVYQEERRWRTLDLRVVLSHLRAALGPQCMWVQVYEEGFRRIGKEAK